MKNHLLMLAIAATGSGLCGYAPDIHAQVRLWGTYYGGRLSDEIESVAVDRFGNIYAVGTTDSPNNISTPGSFDPQNKTKNGFLAKFSPVGARLWATYYGDAPLSRISSVGVDQNGNVYIAGEVECEPPLTLATAQAEDKTCQDREGFLAKFSPDGRRIWGTYFGGEGDEHAVTMFVTAAGDIYFTASTDSTRGIASMPNQNNTLGGGSDAVIAKFDKDGKKLWSRYFGGDGEDLSTGLACRYSAVDAQEICYMVGLTESKTGIATPNSHDKTLGGSYDSFIALIQGSNGQTAWSRYYGGQATDKATSVAIDNDLNAYVGGWTLSDAGMATARAHDTTFNGGKDMFLAKFDYSGNRVAGTYIGHVGNQEASRLVMDADDNLYVLGEVIGRGGNFVTPGAFDTTYGGGSVDLLLMKFTSTLTLTWSTYYGGTGSENGHALAVDKDMNIIVGGETRSTNGISTSDGHQPSKASEVDGYLIKFSQ